MCYSVYNSSRGCSALPLKPVAGTHVCKSQIGHHLRCMRCSREAVDKSLRFISRAPLLLFTGGQSDAELRRVEQGQSESSVVELRHRFPIISPLGQDLGAVIFHNSDLVFTQGHLPSTPGFMYQELLYPVAVQSNNVRSWSLAQDWFSSK